jgi:hypothetical protein
MYAPLLVHFERDIRAWAWDWKTGVLVEEIRVVIGCKRYV